MYFTIIANIHYRLVCSGIKGHIISFVNYLEALYVKKGLFDYVFCIGDFFGDDSNCEAEWNQFKKSGKISKENRFLFKLILILLLLLFKLLFLFIHWGQTR